MLPTCTYVETNLWRRSPFITKTIAFHKRRFLLALVLAGLLLTLWLWVSTLLSNAAGVGADVQPMATDRYVSKTGNDSGGCTSVGNPCRTIQFAVDAANPGDRVLVAGGIYTDVHARNGMTQVVSISKTLTLMGNYDSTFTDRDQGTILRAQGQGRLFYVTGSITVTLDGFGLEEGNATAGGMSSGPAHGGAILSYADNLNLIDVAITNNEALATDARGGGIFHEFGALSLVDSEFNLNEANREGGGVNVRSGQLHVRDTHFNANVADLGGGVNMDTATAWMTNTIFFRNGASLYGGAVNTGGSSVYMWHSSLTLDGLFNSGVFAGYDIYGVPSSIYMTNTLAVSHTVAISTASAANTAVLNGVLWNGNGQNTGGGGTITVTNAYTGDPEFVFEGFTIGANSAAINRGVPGPVSTDFGGDPRLGAPDLGADEYVVNVFLPIIFREF